MITTDPGASQVKSFEYVTLKQRDLIHPLMWHWYISIFSFNNVSVPNMIHKPSTVHKKWLFKIFSNIRIVNLTFLQGKQTSTWDHLLNKFGRPQVNNALYQVSMFHVGWFWIEDILGVLPYKCTAVFLFSRLKLIEQIFIPWIPNGWIWYMVKISPGAILQKSTENRALMGPLNKVKGHPLILTLMFFHVLG